MHMAISVVLLSSAVMAHRQEPLVNVYDDKYNVLCVYTDFTIQMYGMFYCSYLLIYAHHAILCVAAL